MRCAPFVRVAEENLPSRRVRLRPGYDLFADQMQHDVAMLRMTPMLE